MEIKFFKCQECGKVAVMLDGDPSCCSSKMTELKANTVDAAVEKHVPAVDVDGNKVHAKVGSVEHPMLPEHSIRFIALETENGIQVRKLEAGDKPESVFITEDKPVAVYEYCNLHGLWKKEI